MTDFLTSNHCRSKAHCPACRDIEGGRPWRESIRQTFSDLLTVDFACPDGLPWQPRPPAPSADAYEAIAGEIRASPSIEPWTALKEELRLMEAHMELHSGQSSCWKRRQKVRLVAFYRVAMAKTAP